MDPVARFGDRPKGLLRSAFDDLLPDDVKNAPKRGFPTPFAAWFRGPCREFIRERLEEWPEVFEEVIPAKYVHRIVSGHLKGRLPGPFDELRANRIWVLLQLATWARIFRPDAIVEGDPGIVDP
jgi:asparagine synthase (glutamine-hydrolysing)